MLFRLAADAVLLLHVAFILFVLLGAAMALRWRWALIAHLPAAAWGLFVELTARACPLTYWENHLRVKAGQSGYAESFIEHYLLPIIYLYPAGLSREIEFAFAGVVIFVNVAIYVWLLYRRNSVSLHPRLFALRKDPTVRSSRAFGRIMRCL